MYPNSNFELRIRNVYLPHLDLEGEFVDTNFGIVQNMSNNYTLSNKMCLWPDFIQIKTKSNSINQKKSYEYGPLSSNTRPAVRYFSMNMSDKLEQYRWKYIHIYSTCEYGLFRRIRRRLAGYSKDTKNIPIKGNTLLVH